MTKIKFTEAVMKCLPSIVEEFDRDLITADAGRLFDEGWTLTDAVAYLICHEEVSPDLDEGTALAMMAKISKKYKIGA